MPADASLASLSDNLLVVTILIYTAAMMAYAVEYAFGARGRIGVAAGVQKERALVGAGAPAEPATPPTDSGDASDSASGPTSKTPVKAGRLAVVLTVLGVLLHVGVLVTRAFAAHRVPWGNMYEYALTACLIATVGWLVLLARQRQIRHLGTFVMLVIVLLLGTTGLVIYTPVVPLVPALNSYWLWIHVSAATCASGLFVLAFATSLMFLVRDTYEKKVKAGRPLTFPFTLGPRLPDADALERMTFRVVAFAFPIWTFAIICGAIWAEAAWSRFWGWDPKETWSFITWVVYAAYLHARATAGWKGPRAVWIAIGAFAALMFNLFGVNLVISGLHSYAGL